MKKPKVYVLDTSAVIAGFTPGLTDLKQYTVQAVLEEARSLSSKSKLETALIAGNVGITEPSSGAMGIVRETIRKSGDKVSNTDMKLLAVALDLRNENAEPEIVTDDYSIQNLAKLLGIGYRRVLMPGIKTVFGWEMTCPACGLNFPPDASACGVCGSALKRRGRKMEPKG